MLISFSLCVTDFHVHKKLTDFHVHKKQTIDRIDRISANEKGETQQTCGKFLARKRSCKSLNKFFSIEVLKTTTLSLINTVTKGCHQFEVNLVTLLITVY